MQAGAQVLALERMVVEQHVALELASTIRHDGAGGVADDLADAQGLTAWVHARAELLEGWAGARSFVADEAARDEVVRVREAVRALFAYAVRPGAPSQADAHRLLPIRQALDRINEAAARQPVTPRLDWPESGAPVSRVSVSAAADPLTQLTALLARATIAFLTGPHRHQLRACSAPRCVRYFLKEHGRQEWCKPSCGNRARVARHYRRRHPPSQVDLSAPTRPEQP